MGAKKRVTPRTKASPDIKVTSEMVAAGVAALSPFLDSEGVLWSVDVDEAVRACLAAALRRAKT